MMLVISGLGIAFLLYVLMQLRLEENRPRRHSADIRAGEDGSPEPRRFYIVKSRPGQSRSRRGSSPLTGAAHSLAGLGLVNGVRRQKQ